ncbi:MAG: primosomal protein N' [Hahellaceae bacterium]|nr:primosomal protein N' [Hahellaceae bacterium]MCP5168676.1 primosomal protein N' [Hahellaceae bacterium]
MSDTITATIVEVAFFIPLYRTFDYLIPQQTMLCPVPGQRVLAKFNNRNAVGLILAVKSESSVAAHKLKPFDSLIDDDPLINDEMLALARWCSRHYAHPIGEVIELFLPTSLRKGLPVTLAHETRWHFITSTKDDSGVSIRAHKQKQLLDLLRSHPEGTWTSSIKALGFSASQLNALQNKGLIFEERLDALSAGQKKNAPTETPSIQLMEEQLNAARVLIKQLGDYKTTLLQGVTGSGKTEVYLQLIKAALAKNLQALVLIPEINLTPQTLARFQQQLNCPIGVLHSTLNDSERLTAWELARQGVAKVIIGTRSAVFTPFKRLGCIIIDEEHDSAYKQQDGFRYHARDVAVMRGYRASIPVLLGSATPSLESLYNAKTGRYQHLKLHNRPPGVKLPQVQLLDIRSRPLEGGLSRPLMAKISEHLDAKKQVLIFINRRGYAPALMCYDCGWLADCPHCDARLTLHLRPFSLTCHHCNFRQPPPLKCPVCASNNLNPVGAGTEQTEKVLQEHFKHFPVIRVDRDSTRSKSAMNDIFNQIQQGSPCILVGTQMLAKGHNFPMVTLAAIVNADGGLFSADFRAPEHTAQLLIQVAGRAGRADHPGEVIIQTCHGDHPLLKHVCHQNYSAMSALLLEERKAHGLPPCTFAIRIMSESKNQESANSSLNALKLYLQTHDFGTDVFINGPTDAPMARKAGIHMKLLSVICTNRAQQQQLARMAERFLAAPPDRSCKLSLDIDPQEGI